MTAPLTLTQFKSHIRIYNISIEYKEQQPFTKLSQSNQNTQIQVFVKASEICNSNFYNFLMFLESREREQMG